MAYTTMTELMHNYRSFAAEKNWAAAHETLLYGVECSHLPAKLELAQLYKECTQLGIHQQERYARSEFHYRGILNLLDDVTDKVTATICMELAELYSYMKRPVAVLGMLLRAKRYGANVPDREVDYAWQLLLNLDINDFGKFPRDAYELGLELSLAGGSVRLTELLLQEATECTNKLIRDQAALALADFYNDRRSENYVYASEATRYYRMAAESGYPEYISRRIAK